MHEGFPAHNWLSANPSIIDWNGDGLFDIYVAEETFDDRLNSGGSGMTAGPAGRRNRGGWLLANTGVVGKPLFTAAYLNGQNGAP